MKTCTRCKERKPLSDFYLIMKHGKKVPASRCKACMIKIACDWNKNNPHRTNQAARRRYRENPEKESKRLLSNRLNMLYGISLEQYNSMLVSQGGVCVICGNPPTKGRLHIDHCHAGSGIRGLLCNNCNLGLGNFKDNPHLLLKAKIYLEEFYAKRK